MDYDLIVLGAGMAGLTAARTLAEAGRRVLLPEAQDRIGGRILTRHIHGEAIELGAEFVHGNPPELWSLIREAGLATYERDGGELCFEDGTLAECQDDRDDTFSLLEDLARQSGPDLSFAAYLDRRGVTGGQREQAIGFVEGFNAADHRVASVAALARQQRAEDSIDGDRVFRLRDGYDQLPAFLAARFAAAGGTLVLGTPVETIDWRPGQVEVRTPKAVFTARRAVVTLPLGVLQSGVVAITPPPGDVLTAAAGLRMGQVRRFTLRFRERFWAGLPPQPAMNELSFLFSTGEMPPVWWTPHPEASNTLTGWVGGPRSAALNGMSNEALADVACYTLARVFSLNAAHIQSLLLGCETHDWRADPYALGAYSYVATGGLEASARMAEPVQDTLYFAGEHTDTTGHWGTVHAAMRSGLRAAAQVLAAG